MSLYDRLLLKPFKLVSIVHVSIMLVSLKSGIYAQISFPIIKKMFPRLHQRCEEVAKMQVWFRSLWNGSNFGTILSFSFVLSCVFVFAFVGGGGKTTVGLLPSTILFSSGVNSWRHFIKYKCSVLTLALVQIIQMLVFGTWEIIPCLEWLVVLQPLTVRL